MINHIEDKSISVKTRQHLCWQWAYLFHILFPSPLLVSNVHTDGSCIDNQRRGMRNQKIWIAQAKYLAITALLHISRQPLSAFQVAIHDNQAINRSRNKRESRPQQNSRISPQ